MADFVALDFTGAQVLVAKGKQREFLSHCLPACLLPLYRGEAPLFGLPTEAHRRGSGLFWPPEAQVPVANDPERGSGRVPLAALWALLCEEKAGILADQSVSWRPMNQELSANSAELLAGAAGAWNPQAEVMVTPDTLGPAGQQSFLDALNRDVHLIPASIAAALSWLRSQPTSSPLCVESSPGDGTPAGHIWVLHAGLGRWTAMQVPIRAVSHGDKVLLCPVYSRRRLLGDLGRSGAALLNSRGNMIHLMTQHWDSAWVDGRLALASDLGHQVQVPGWQALLAMNPEIHFLNALKSGMLKLETTDNCHGLLIHGEWAETLPHLASSLGFKRLSFSGTSVNGAAITAQALTKKLPSWKEELDPLDFYYSGLDKFGNPIVAWKTLIANATVDAGQTYAPEPIKGLGIPPGADKLGLTVRMTDQGFEYRGINARLEKPLIRESPVLLHVRVSPGQGFAKINVVSQEPGLFEASLDWRHLEKVPAPVTPKLGYIPRSVVIRADIRLWNQAKPHLKAFLSTSQKNRDFLYATKMAVSIMRKWPKAMEFEQGYGYRNKISDIYLFYSAIGSDGTLPEESTQEDRELWLACQEKALAILRKGDLRFTAELQAIRRLMSWGYASCPYDYINDSYQMVRAGHGKMVYLQVLGNSFNTKDNIRNFWLLAFLTLPENPTPNAWLMACRNIIRLNEDALSCLDDEEAMQLLSILINHVKRAHKLGRPQVLGNALESVMHLLKRRRYQPDFLAAASEEYQYLENLIVHNLLGNSRSLTSVRLARRHKEFLPAFLDLLRSQADESSIASLVMTDEESDDDE